MNLAKIAGAESMFLGTINIEIQEGFLDIGWLDHLIPLIYIGDRTNITFSGRITSVKNGYVLVSGEKTSEFVGFKQEYIHEVIHKWFKDVKEID